MAILSELNLDCSEYKFSEQVRIEILIEIHLYLINMEINNICKFFFTDYMNLNIFWEEYLQIYSNFRIFATLNFQLATVNCQKYENSVSAL